MVRDTIGMVKAVSQLIQALVGDTTIVLIQGVHPQPVLTQQVGVHITPILIGEAVLVSLLITVAQVQAGHHHLLAPTLRVVVDLVPILIMVLVLVNPQVPILQDIVLQLVAVPNKLVVAANGLIGEHAPVDLALVLPLRLLPEVQQLREAVLPQVDLALQVTTGWVITEVGVCQMEEEVVHRHLLLAQPRLLPRNQLLHQPLQNQLLHQPQLHHRQNLHLHHLLHLQSHLPLSSCAVLTDL